MAKTTPEKKVQNKIINHLKSLKAQGFPLEYFRRNASGPNYKKGLPDLYIILGPYHIEVEVKAENGSLSTDQIKWQSRFSNIGAAHWVCFSDSDFIHNLNTFIKNYIS